MANLNLEELDELAKSLGFSGAHNAITCSELYRNAYSKKHHANQELYKLILGLKLILPKQYVEVLDAKLNELTNDEFDFNIIKLSFEKE